GFLKLERVKKEKVWGLFGNDFDYKIHILQKEDTKKKLALHQIEILQFIVQRAKTDSKIGSNSILFGEIESYAKKNRSSFRVFFESWQDQTKEELKKLQLFERDSKGLWILSIGTISFIGIMILLVSLSFDFLPFVLIWAFLLFIPISLRITTKRTPKGVLHYKKWKNLKKYLKDFTLVKEHSPDGIMLWEKFLVYATTFGIADKVTKYMNELVPPKEFAHSAIFYGTVSASQYAGFGQSFAAFSSSFATSTGTGGSGGFGGGGGGGGGGGAG
ncbi:DUF2207 domain-containing protein, partial [Candidatus Micrarchaeota archaeon]|nr:DUF2207 domain-containing protein [Candidatus Micrarchaeota archaeon]